MYTINYTLVHILVLVGVSYAQSNPYLEYGTLCPSATISASSAKVQSCEQSIYTAVMSRADCQPVPVASCECEWFNSWVSTCLPAICPSTGLAAIASSRGTVYCTPTGAGMTDMTPMTTSAMVTPGAGTTTPVATGSQGAATTTTKAGSARALVVPFGGTLLAGLVAVIFVAV
ncbi:hypothetical protein TWF694_001499 [Orbilia ellipsospora]|uniref:Uncharacterized protein n=1 Tax=Orbilia ellipsospora TaxID=2528407 RepID=A0AAV9XS83_9PEZI